MITGQQVQEAVIASKLTYIPHHSCSICDEMVAFIVEGTDLFFDSSCGCSKSIPRLSSWDDAAQWINMQSNDYDKEEIMKKFGIIVGTK